MREVIHARIFRRHVDFFTDLFRNFGVTGILLECRIRSPPVALFPLIKAVIIPPVFAAADAVKSRKQPEGTDRIFTDNFNRFVRISFFEHKIEQPAKLRSVLQTRRPTHDFNALQCLRRRRVVTLRIAESVGTDVVAVLPGVEVGSAIRVETARADAELQSRAVVFPDVETCNSLKNLPGVVGRYVGD